MTVRPVALALSLLLAACGQGGDDAASATAVGEVLPGSISDSMIELDTTTAAPPLAPARAEPAKKTSSSQSTSAVAAEADQPTVTLPEAAPSVASAGSADPQ